MVAILRIAQGRHRYLTGDVEEAGALLRRAVAARRAAAARRRCWCWRWCTSPTPSSAAATAPPPEPRCRGRGRSSTTSRCTPFATERLEEAETRIGRVAARAAARTGVLVEELTDRELSILRMLPGSATQREIGAALFLSINTVKAYNKSLYRKLGVASGRTRSPPHGARPDLTSPDHDGICLS